MKLYAQIILLFIISLWFTACSGLGFNFEEKRTVLITRSPMQIALTGDMDEELTNNTIRVIEAMNKYPFIEYKFNPSVEVNMHASDTSTDTTSSNSDMSMNRNRSRQDIYTVQP